MNLDAGDLEKYKFVWRQLTIGRQLYWADYWRRYEFEIKIILIGSFIFLFIQLEKNYQIVIILILKDCICRPAHIFCPSRDDMHFSIASGSF